MMKYKCDNMFRISSICLTIFLLCLMSTSVSHAENYSAVQGWGSFLKYDGSSTLGLIKPEGIAVNPSDNVYFYGGFIYVFDSNGTSINRLSLTDNGASLDSNYLALDSSNNLYFGYGYSIYKFDSQGNLVTKWGSQGSDIGQFNGIAGVATDSSGKVYVVDSGNNRIEKFDSVGTYLTQWGSSGIGDGQFNRPLGIAVDSSGNVYVVDMGNDRIEKFDSNGANITHWGSSGRGDGQFDVPDGIAVDSSGNVYVVDTRNDRIEKFDNNGNYLTQFGSHGTWSGQLSGPTRVAVDSSGNVYVSDSGNYRVQKFFENNNPTPVLPPVANFTCSVTEGSAPLTVNFTDSSQNAEGWKWTFGDGTSSTEQNPTHIYQVGTNNVILTVSNAKGTNSKSITIYARQAINSNNADKGSTEVTSATALVTQPETNTSNIGQSNGNTPANTEQTPVQTATSTPAKQSTKTPGFEIISGITAMFAVFLLRKR